MADPADGRAVIIRTGLGPMRAELYPDRAPVSCAYFLADVDAGRYADTTIFRIPTEANHTSRGSPAIEVMQGGAAPVDLAPSIIHESTAETGLRHRRGTLSLARFRPGAVYHSFFICFRDEPALDHGGLRNPDGLGFAAFGAVVEGWEVLDAIRARAEVGERLTRVIPLDVMRGR